MGAKSKATKLLSIPEGRVGGQWGTGRASGRNESKPWKWAGLGWERAEAQNSEPGGGAEEGRGEENFWGQNTGRMNNRSPQGGEGWSYLPREVGRRLQISQVGRL